MIEVNNLTKVKVEEILIKKVVQIVLKGENKKNINLSIAFVGPSRIKNLNKKYRRKNYVTDVLAFGENGGLGLGEIVICLQEVKKNAKKYALSFEKELINCLIHGILHLLGYEHEKSKEEMKKMRKKEEEYFLKIFPNLNSKCKNQNAK